MAAFGLAALLRIRKLKEERAAYDVTRARSRASELAQDRHRLIDQLDDHGHDARDVRGIHAISAARASTSTMLADLAALAETQQRLVTEAEASHRSARRDVRTIEKLEERHAETAQQEALRIEQLLLDELATRRRPEVDGR